MTNENRIKLAEAMFDGIVIGKNRNAMWQVDNEGKAILGSIRPIPNPYESDADCMALVRWLNEQGYRVRIDWRRPKVCFIEIQRDGTTNWKFGAYYDAVERDDYKQGVCELALKVIDDD